MSERSKIIKKLDTQFSLAIRARDKRCLRCNKSDNLQCAHIFSRSKKSVRWDMNNAVTLCGGCHLFWAHKFPLDFYDWVRGRMGEANFKALRQKADFAVSISTKELQLLAKTTLK